MKKFLSILISFIISYISIIILGKTIPAGYEMGAIGIAFTGLFRSLITCLVITMFYILVSASKDKKSEEEENYKLEIIYIITSAIVSTAVYSLSIYSEV